MPIEATLLRIAQEAVGNVLLHAAAASCRVRLDFESDAVTIEIDDDGRGFDVDAALERSGAASASFGLAGMRARAADLGGYAALVSSAGDGTLVSARIPVSADAGTQPHRGRGQGPRTRPAAVSIPRDPYREPRLAPDLATAVLASGPR